MMNGGGLDQSRHANVYSQYVYTAYLHVVSILVKDWTDWHFMVLGMSVAVCVCVHVCFFITDLKSIRSSPELSKHWTSLSVTTPDSVCSVSSITFPFNHF